MSLFRKRPVVVDATQWLSHKDTPLQEVETMTFYDHGDEPCRHCGERDDRHGWVKTLEGGHIVCPGDWIITGVKGEKYPCKPDIFKDTYEPA